MSSLQIYTFCMLIIVLGEFTYTKPLAGWNHETSLRHRGDEEKKEIPSSFTERDETISWSLNSSQVLFQEKSKMNHSQFMIDLYNRYVTDKKAMPMSNIVRSFTAEDVLFSSSSEDPIQSHILLFNVSIPQHEEVTQAELKIYVSSHDNYNGNMLLYDILHMNPAKNLKDTHSFLQSKEFEGSEWVTTDVTKAVKRWVKSENEKNKLEIFLKSKHLVEHFDDPGAFVVTQNPPFLIIFSDNKYIKIKEDKTGIREMISYEQASSLEMVSQNYTLVQEKKEENVGEIKKSLKENKKRITRSVKSNYCRKSSLIVNFQDIGWDSWILGPKSYDAGECKGECYYPLTDNLKPTNHALVQTLMHQKYPKKVKKACCVPTRLEPIQIMYIDDGIPTINLNYQGMKVAECGCR
ncbi:growth/differentiation factor 2 [Spea bombifrons]|uniref:growth/differentiation factor 2 n=1 Tax=Spea bombifrons TaxID=233779 RepID=UPI00234B2CB2|nr:growth/differentiation factor 2 [Spea bombifrons]